MITESLFLINDHCSLNIQVARSIEGNGSYTEQAGGLINKMRTIKINKPLLLPHSTASANQCQTHVYVIFIYISRKRRYDHTISQSLITRAVT